ncbi:MAG: NMD3-related protein [bacterium]|nr:NMD3-related protein [bacterium]
MPKSTHANNPKYFEATIQLRPFDPDVFEFIEQQIKNKKNPEYFISKIDELKTGIDIYFSSQRYARTLGQLLKRKFPKGILLITKKMHTRDRMSDRELSRATVLFRLKPERNYDEEE